MVAHRTSSFLDDRRSETTASEVALRAKWKRHNQYARSRIMHATALITAQPHSAVVAGRRSDGREVEGMSRRDWERVAIHTYVRRAPLARKRRRGVLRARGQTDASLNARVRARGSTSTGPCIRTPLCVLACLLDVVPSIATRGRVSRIVNTTHHARHVPRRENVRTLRACTRSFTRGRAHGRKINESRETQPTLRVQINFFFLSSSR